jgi:serine phosphatase RsbU (regulator of sigma subunit)
MALGEARLEVSDASGRRIVALDKESFTIGRSSGSDLRIFSVDVSRDHAQLVLNGDRWILRDCGSRYGTFVNDVAVSVDVNKVLSHRDRIRLGRSGGAELAFLVGDDTHSGSSSKAASAVGDLRQLAALLEGLRAIGSAHVLDEVLALVLDSAINVAGAERGFVMLANAEGALQFACARARGKVTLPGKSFETSRKIPEEVFATGREKIVSDLQDANLADAHHGTVALGIRHVLCVPLRLVRYVDDAAAVPEQKRIGVLYLDSREKGTLLTTATRSGLETLATEAATAIENARLYKETLEKARMDQELKIAAEIQQALLPPGDYVGPGFSVAGASLPCRAVGGDFFDYLELPDGSFGLVIGDVAGKGPPAALLTAAVQGMFVGQAMIGGSPGSALASVNRSLIRRAIQSRFVTMMYGVLSQDGTLKYSNGGHNPPFLITKDGVKRLETGGLILGLFGHAMYEEETLQMQPDDVLVVFSDGVSEAVDVAGEEFGDDRILAAVAACPNRDPKCLLDALLDEVKKFSVGTPQRDDVTVVMVRFTGK